MKVISRKAAIARGLKQYRTKKKCVRGHTAPRGTLDRRCLECKRISKRVPVGMGVVDRKADPRFISLNDARKLGLPRYFTGIPCKRGHVVERHTASGACVSCRTLLGRSRKQRLNSVDPAWRKGENARRWERQRGKPEWIAKKREADRARRAAA